MRQLVAGAALLTMTACATVTAEPDQEISVSTTPVGATCSLQNNEGTWTIPVTPGAVRVERSFSVLTIYCSHTNAGKGEASLEPKTRGRAWGNLLMFGYPAAVDAATGDGYEYEPAVVSIPLKAE
jgi:hypothetical protein